MLSNLSLECINKHLLVALLQIMMVEPEESLDVEVSTVLRTLGKVKEADHLVHSHEVLVIARVPAKQCKEVDHSLRQIAALAIARIGCVGAWHVPQQWEHREAILVAIALRELTVAFWCKEQRQMSKLWSLPAERTVEEDVQRRRW